MLSYSAGGNYAYNVAAAMEKQDESILALILIDNFRVMETAVWLPT
ncbi:MAG: hypothetical protein Q8N96_12525 [Methylovulum sp.]|nr:hypothetical protein [Methylovulum sp.]